MVRRLSCKGGRIDGYDGVEALERLNEGYHQAFGDWETELPDMVVANLSLSWQCPARRRRTEAISTE